LVERLSGLRLRGGIYLMPVVAKPTVLQAVKTLYDSIGGGLPTLWLDEVPEGQGYPRALLRDGGEVADEEINEDFGNPTESRRDFSIELIVENDSDTAETLGLLVLNAFKPNAIQLTFDSNARLDHTKRRWTTGSSGQRSPDDKPLYSSTINYSVQMGTDY
jgi:hypothetical protein